MADYQEIVDADLRTRPGYVGALLAEAGECLLLTGETAVAADILSDIVRVHDLGSILARDLQMDRAYILEALESRNLDSLLAIFAAVARVTDARLTIQSGAPAPAADGRGEPEAKRPGSGIPSAA